MWIWDDGGHTDGNAKHVVLACKKRSTTGVTAAGMSTGVPDCSADWLRGLTGKGALLTPLSSGSDSRLMSWPCSSFTVYQAGCVADITSYGARLKAL